MAFTYSAVSLSPKLSKCLQWHSHVPTQLSSVFTAESTGIYGFEAQDVCFKLSTVETGKEKQWNGPGSDFCCSEIPWGFKCLHNLLPPGCGWTCSLLLSDSLTCLVKCRVKLRCLSYFEWFKLVSYLTSSKILYII